MLSSCTAKLQLPRKEFSYIAMQDIRSGISTSTLRAGLQEWREAEDLRRVRTEGRIQCVCGELAVAGCTRRRDRARRRDRGRGRAELLRTS
jgi:hypothetical protein